MTAKKKAPKKNARKPAKKQPAPAPYNAQDPGEKRFVRDTYDQTRQLLSRIQDPERRRAFDGRLKAIRAKFNALPKNKVTKERVERYVEEITKVGREIIVGA